ncbi:MAG: ABC transporter ATP-binding protein, partial [Oscillospiraceae bacterium]|nr:ABC transporter ATP-binding protein [Candidatus Equicaccousia limihippi]
MLSCVREYKLPTFLTLLFIVLEAVIETFIPLLTADLVDKIRVKTDISEVVSPGLILVALAVASLCCGGIAGYTFAKASAGFAKNLRHDMFYRIQGYSFENIDKFSSSSLVTRMTTDVTNVQMSYMMIIRIAVRAPLMLVFSIVAAYSMGGALATPFVVIIPILTAALLLIGKNAMPAFKSVFRKYDKLNESIEENVRGIRVVKGFAREDFEKKKFGIAATDICKDFTKAERIVALNGPVMQFCIYFNLIFILILGSYFIISTGATMIDVGEISAMLTYGFQILMQLMMLSMIYVMLTMSSESLKRIGEVLDEKTTLESPENAVKTVSDGSIAIENVGFKYSKHAR